MGEEKSKYSSTFFDKVASHNLERFHSECIAWIFNTNRNAAKSFIIKIHELISNDSKNGITKIQQDDIIFDENDIALAEEKQIDIRIRYTIKYQNSKYLKQHILFIENKIKASEHLIEDKKFKDYDILKNHNLKISQTQYYYFREEKNRNENTPIHIYIYLKPTIANEQDLINIFPDYKTIDFDFNKYNQWDIINNITNPWFTITYKDLYNSCISNLNLDPNGGDYILAKSYLNYINKFNDKIDFNDYSKNDVNSLSFGKYDFFKILFSLIKNSIKENFGIDLLQSEKYDNKSTTEFYYYLNPSSSNGKDPIFGIFKQNDTKKDFHLFEKLNEKKVIEINKIDIGIQLEGKTFKFYTSAANKYYNDIKIKNPINGESGNKVYLNYVKENYLSKLTENINQDLFKTKNKGYNAPTSLTFASRSLKINGFDDIKSKNIKCLHDEIFSYVKIFFNSYSILDKKNSTPI